MIVSLFAYRRARQHAVHVAIKDNIPMTAASTTSHGPGEAIKLAADIVRFTEHESITLTEYLAYVSNRDCFTAGLSIMVCIS